MSKIVKATCKIREVERDILEKALELFAKHHNATLSWLEDEKVKVICNERGYYMYATIALDQNDEINITTESSMMKNTREIIEQYYAAVDVGEEYGVEPEMNKQGELLLNLEVA